MTDLDLTGLRTLGVTGAPLTAAPYSWVRDRVGAHVQTGSTSGGTDVAGGFRGLVPAADLVGRVRDAYVSRLPQVSWEPGS